MNLFVLAPFIQLIGIGVPVAGCIVLFQKEQSKVSMSLMLANVGCFIINCAYLLLFGAKSYEAAFSLLKVLYLGNAVFYISFILFLTTYLNVGNTRLRTILMAIWGTIEGTMVFLIWLGDPFKMVFANVEVREIGVRGITFVYTIPGILYRVRNAVVCLILACGMVYTLIRMIRVKMKEERHNLGRLCGAQAVVVCASYMMLFLRLPFDIVPICSSVSILFIILGVIRGDFFRVTDKGRDWVLEHAEHIFVLADNVYGFLDANSYAKQVFPKLEVMEKNQELPKEVKELFVSEESCIGIEDRHFTKKVAPIEQNGSVIGYSMLLLDVSYQVSMMEQLEVEKEKAESANKAKSAFMSNMSHEIRTPMNAIVGMTDILLREDLPPQTKEYLNNIKSSGNALLTIINDILDFSKIEAGKMEIIEDEYEPMSSLHDLSMIFLNRIGDKDVELIYDIDPQLPARLYGDRQRIRQIIINLMNNAIKFTDEGFVKLTVKAEPESEKTVKVSYFIEDSGQGIRKEDLDKLFGDFQQVDTRKNHYKEGTGLGLSISKQLVELMGGTIGVTSEYGKGSTFYFSLTQEIRSGKKAANVKPEYIENMIVSGCFKSPLILQQYEKLVAAYGLKAVSGDALAESNAPVGIFFTDDMHILSNETQLLLEKWNTKLCLLQNPMKQNYSGIHATLINKPLYSLNFCQAVNGETITVENENDVLCFTAPEAKILIVDDHEMNLKVAKGLLEPLHMQIDTAENGREALEKVRKKEYHMVFMDHMMPVMDGIEATQAIRKLEDEYFKQLPIVALSANATTEARELFRENGFNDFVAKPIKLKELCKCIRTWLPEKLLDVSSKEEPSGDVLSERKETGEQLPVIEGLNVAEGIENSGSKELFFSLLGDFYKLIDKKATKIEKLLADGMLRDYTIEVHALKSTARMIGAMELSQEFYELEQLGNAGEQKILETKTPAVLSLYRSYKPILEPYGRGNEEKEAVPTEVILTALEQLKTAMDSFDLDGADETMKKLEGYAFPEEYQGKLEDLSTLVADVAMEEVMALTDELMNELQK